MVRQSNQKLVYPITFQGDGGDIYHGTFVADPFRWLEDPDNPKTQAWMTRQNKLTSDYLHGFPLHAKLKMCLTEIWNHPRYSLPYQVGNRTFFFKNDGLQNQPVLYMQSTSEASPIMVFDSNQLSADGTAALSDWAFNNDGTLLAYAISHNGSDWQEFKIRDIDTGQDYPEVIQGCKSEEDIPFPNVTWHHNSSGFYYNRLPAPGSVPTEDQYNYSQVYWHQLGTSQTEDQLIYERPDAKELGFVPIVTDDGQYLVLHVWHGLSHLHRIYYRPVADDSPFIRLLDRADARYNFIGNVGTIFFFGTNLDAPRGRVIAIDIENPGRDQWREIVPEQEDTIAFVNMVNERLAVVTVHHAHHQLTVYDLQGKTLETVELPTMGTIVDIAADSVTDEMFIAFESFLMPTTIFRYDFEATELSTWHAPELDFDFTTYETKQQFYQAQDGAQVPIFLVHKKELRLDGNNPTILYGYGGFNVSETPWFDPSRLVWLENGGVFAVANLRGGGEYGEAWHQAGMLEKKQIVFDDFIAAAEWLRESQYTNPQKLAISGGSNGGLLVTACMLQRPELVAAVTCDIPVTDMLRYHKFTLGSYWIPEYGNAETDPDHFDFLYAYSPLHNVQLDATYPPILLTTADTDDRVVPAHALKFAATLQATASDNPILLRIETNAGHGLGKPTSKLIEVACDVYTFLMIACGVSLFKENVN